MALSPPSPIRREAAISACGQYRWWLRREWGDGARILWVMLNPARADDARDDPTIRRVIEFSRNWGFGAATIVNLYPFRSTSPAACRSWIAGDSPATRKHMRENDRIIDSLLAGSQSVVAAWGTVGWARDRAERMAKRLKVRGMEPVCLGTTADGSPLHPLARGRKRVPNDRQPTPWASPTPGNC